MAYHGENYHWGPTSPHSPTYFTGLSPDSSSPRSASSTLNYGSGGSDFSASSAHSSRTSHGAVYVNVNGQKVADIHAPTTSSRRHRRQEPEGGEPSRRQHRPRRPSTVIISGADDRQQHQPRHSRHGSNTSYDSRGSRTVAPNVAEPEAIYVEENVGDARPPRALIYDNRGRTRHRRHDSDVQINVHPASRSRSRRHQHRSASRGAAQPPSFPRIMSWSDDEQQQQQQQAAPIQRKSSMKRTGSTRRRDRRKSVTFSPDTPDHSDLADKIAAIRLQNQEIGTRPAVPDSPPAHAPAPAPAAAILDDPRYYRPQVTTVTYDPADLEEAERSDEDRRLERLRRRQETRPPVTRHERQPAKRRRNSVGPATAPPMGVYNPYIHHY